MRFVRLSSTEVTSEGDERHMFLHFSYFSHFRLVHTLNSQQTETLKRETNI